MFVAPSYLSSLGLSLLLLGLGMVLLPSLDRQDARARALVLGLAVILAWRYLLWRFTVTIPPLDSGLSAVLPWGFALLEAVTIVSATSAFVILSRTRSRSGEVDRHLQWWGAAPPRVDVYIATYNEDADVLERTLTGAITLAYPAARVFVLDDGRRPWLETLCRSYGVDYLTRDGNAHAKAGNMNAAFRQRLQAEDAPVFVAVLDADFVPHRDFVTRALALFHDPAVGLVQTPQHFFNEDPIQHNLSIGQGYPDEQRFFFDHLEPARDAWGIAVCCGTSSMVRAEGLQAIGGFPTESVTEDFLLTVKLAEKGWKTVYLNEALTEGLAPEGLKEYIVQRGRWCLGTMQMIRNGFSPWSRRPLSWTQRWSLADSALYWISTFPFRLASLVCPLLYWFFGVTVVNATVEDVLFFYLPFNIASLMALNWLSGGLLVPVLNDVSQLLAAWPITRAVALGLATPGPHKFKVTGKGGDRTKTVVQWGIMRPFLVLSVLTVIGLLWSTWRDVDYDQKAGEGMYVVLFWTLYNLVVLAVAMAACIERPRRDGPRAFVPEPAVARLGARDFRPWITGLGAGFAELRGLPALKRGEPLLLDIARVGEVAGEVAYSDAERTQVTLNPRPEQTANLLVRLHTAQVVPSTTRGSLGEMLRQVGRTLRTRFDRA